MDELGIYARISHGGRWLIVIKILEWANVPIAFSKVGADNFIEQSTYHGIKVVPYAEIEEAHRKLVAERLLHGN